MSIIIDIHSGWNCLIFGLFLHMNRTKQQEFDIISSPLGHILIVVLEQKLVMVEFADANMAFDGVRNPNNETIKLCKQQLHEYFDGKRKYFNLPVEISGTQTQVESWKYLQQIPYGQTVSYQDEAIGIGNKAAVRPVANANGKNKIAIIIPCHRVIGKNGKLTGYGGGLWRKEWLLTHESKFRSA